MIRCVLLPSQGLNIMNTGWQWLFIMFIHPVFIMFSNEEQIFYHNHTIICWLAFSQSGRVESTPNRLIPKWCFIVEWGLDTESDHIYMTRYNMTMRLPDYSICEYSHEKKLNSQFIKTNLQTPDNNTIHQYKQTTN